MKNLEFKIRNEGTAEQDWPKYRIDTEDGVTVAEVFGEENQKLGRLFAAAPDLLILATELEKELASEGYGAKSTELDELAVTLAIFLRKLKNG